MATRLVYHITNSELKALTDIKEEDSSVILLKLYVMMFSNISPKCHQCEGTMLYWTS